MKKNGILNTWHLFTKKDLCSLCSNKGYVWKLNYTDGRMRRLCVSCSKSNYAA